eukprot:767198-Hanusia_phi.AAC.1
MLCDVPAATRILNPLIPGTGMPTIQLAWFPCPVCPTLLLPITRTCPSLVTTNECSPPHAMSRASERMVSSSSPAVKVSCFGTKWSVSGPSMYLRPSCPNWFFPNPYTVPLTSRTTVCSSPHAIFLIAHPSKKET